MEDVPQRLKPDSLQSIYVRPEGRTLQKHEFFRKLWRREAVSQSCDDAVLERELCRELHQPRRLGANDMAKVGIFHLPIHRSRTIELRVVESVKSLQAELQ
jgi:hypothetical protein